MKRQRVELACHKCRVLRAEVFLRFICSLAWNADCYMQCDGQRPICGRCAGYGFTCIWTERRRPVARDGRRVLQSDGDSIPSTPLPENKSPSVKQDVLFIPQNVARSYEALVQSVRPKLDGAERAAFDMTLAKIHQQLPDQLATQAPVSSPANEVNKKNVDSPTYFGNASDIHFFNTVRNCMREHEEFHAAEDREAQTYEQTDVFENRTAFGKPLQLPPREEERQFLDIYFSTIHVAYPFLCKSTVLRHFQRIWNDELNDLIVPGLHC